MGRTLRPLAPDTTYHLMARGSGKRKIFEGDADRFSFLRIVDTVSLERGWRHHAWCLMTNHVHFLTTTPSADLSDGMSEILGQYSRRFGHFNERTGHLFADRFRSVVVDHDEQFLATVRYIALNPIKAGLASKPDAYWWSSHSDRDRQRRLLDSFDESLLLAMLSPLAKVADAQYRALIAAAVAPSRAGAELPSIGTLIDALGGQPGAVAAIDLGYEVIDVAEVSGLSGRQIKYQVSCARRRAA